MPRLKNEQKVTLDVGNAKGLRIHNVTTEEVMIYIDHYQGKSWSAIIGEKRLAGGAVFECTRIELGHDEVRVSVRGADTGVDLIQVDVL
jgi:hypothetical protein